MSAYSDLTFGRFALGAVVAGLPLLLIKDRDNANAYVVLIVLGFIVTNWQPLSRATAYVRGQLRTPEE